MKITKLFSFSVTAILLGVAACAAPPTLPPAPDVNDLNTAVAQTFAAAITQSLLPATQTSVPDVLLSTSTLTFTPEPATFTPTISATPTWVFTPTQPVPLISVSVSTNCRSGPGKVYGYKSALLVGKTAEVLARDPSGNYWYIPNPESPGDFCWVWGEYATITGNTAALPVYTPPPTPTITFTPVATITSTPGPGIQVSYTSMDSCAGWWVEFKLTNTGGLNLKSVEITVFDSDTHVTISNLSDGFVDINGCLTSTTKDVLSPDTATVVSAPAFLYDPSGHEIELTVKACSKLGQTGQCITRKIEFVP